MMMNYESTAFKPLNLLLGGKSFMGTYFRLSSDLVACHLVVSCQETASFIQITLASFVPNSSFSYLVT